MKFHKKLAIALLCAAVLAAGSNLSARSFLPEEGQKLFDLEQIFHLHSALLSADMLQLLQVFVNPDEPLAFYKEASHWTDEEAEIYGRTYIGLMFPQLAGKIPFYYFSSLEEFCEATGQDLGDGPFEQDEILTSMDELREIYPSGIVRANPYDMLRTAARQLAYWIELRSEDGKAPAAEKAQALVDFVVAQISKDYEARMAEEAAAEKARTETEAKSEP